MALSLAGKHCAIVGATGIIGSSIARAFANQGAVLTLLSRTILDAKPKFESDLAVYSRPGDQPPGRPHAHRFIPLDVSQPESIKGVFDSKDAASAASPKVGAVDILVNCAGISQTTLLKRTSAAELSNVLDTNLLSTMLACKYAKLESKGCIINVSSLMASKGAIGATAYAASKAGVVGFTRALCLEMSARSIRVNALLPGWVQSSMWDALKPQLKDEYLKGTPLRRVASADEIAHAAVFLASNEFANNCVLNLDGGLSAT